MKIQTTEAVRRFNAQVELVDIALDFAANEITDPGALDRLLQLTGHRELGETFKESMRQVMITGSGWPDARKPGQPPGKAAASPTTKSAVSPHEPWCMCHSCCEAEADRQRGILPDYIIEDNKRLAAEAYKLWQHDEMRTTLKQAHEALGVSVWFCHEKEAHKTVKDLCNAALKRINSIIPPSEV